MPRKSNKAKLGASKKSAKQPRKAAKVSLRGSNKKAPSKPNKVTGTVLKIVNGRPTNTRISAEKAFGDPQQAVEQVLYAQRHGSREELRLVRSAYRQYQSKRYRSK
jgi:hypothetical protein